MKPTSEDKNEDGASPKMFTTLAIKIVSRTNLGYARWRVIRWVIGTSQVRLPLLQVTLVSAKEMIPVLMFVVRRNDCSEQGTYIHMA